MSQRGSRFQGKPQKRKTSALTQIKKTMGILLAGLTALITPAVVSAQDTERIQPATTITPTATTSAAVATTAIVPLVAASVAAAPAAVTPLHVFISDNGKRREVITIMPTVKTVLRQENIWLGNCDILTPAIETPLKDGMEIVLTRILLRIVKEKASIAPPIKTRLLSRTANSYQKIKNGTPGVKEQVIQVWTRDGVEYKRKVIGEKIIKNPTPTIVTRGKLASRSAGEILLCEATAYDPGPLSCGKWASGYTATGAKAERGIIAVDPRFIPLGTRVYVDGYGYALAADTGGAIKGRIIDVCFPTRREALNWGRRMVRVRIL